ncbi:hypothetical protein CSC64_06695 [Pseudoxanthomonas koreensis]|nr:hypothetical protein CSC64_06695 [Pseudoxanthomonas koreensis]
MAQVELTMVLLCEAAAAELGAGWEFELALGELVGKARREHERRMRDAQAAELLPLGRVVAAERLGVATRTVYHMAHRHRDRICKVG